MSGHGAMTSQEVQGQAIFARNLVDFYWFYNFNDLFFVLNSRDFGPVYILHGIQGILDPSILILRWIQRDLGSWNSHLCGIQGILDPKIPMLHGIQGIFDPEILTLRGIQGILDPNILA